MLRKLWIKNPEASVSGGIQIVEEKSSGKE